MTESLSATPAVLTVEIAVDQAAAGARPPEPLSRDAAEVLAGAVAADLRRILGERVHSAGLALPGALYDLTELLRPGLPLVEGLLDVYRGSLRGGPFEAQLVALGSSGGRFPVSALAPARAPGSGPLLAVPFALVAPGEQLDALRTQLEGDLLEKGGASLDTDRIVRQHFGVDPVHLTYATFNDLGALMRVQLDHAGFGPLWRLIESALYDADAIEAVALESGNRFLTRHGQVWTPIEDLDTWSKRHDVHSPERALAGYTEWQKRQRQYMAGLMAHGLEIHPVSGACESIGDATGDAITQAQRLRLADPALYPVTMAGSRDFSAAAAIVLTEQRAPGVGPFAYTVLAQRDDGGLAYLGHDYPLTPEAVPLIREHWSARARDLATSFHVESPESALVGGDPPALMPWLNYDG